MADKEKKKQQDVEPKEEPKEQPKDDFVDMIKQLKETQKKDMERLTKSFEDKIAERDKIIKDLISSEQHTTNEGTSSVADLINKTRNYKQW